MSCDIDAEALDVCRENLSDFSDDVELPVDIINCDVTLPYLYSRWKGIIDTVIMNPPFGTKNNEGMFNRLIFSYFSPFNETCFYIISCACLL